MKFLVSSNLANQNLAGEHCCIVSLRQCDNPATDREPKKLVLIGQISAILKLFRCRTLRLPLTKYHPNHQQGPILEVILGRFLVMKL